MNVRIDMNGHDITADELTVVRRCIERLHVLRAATAAGTADLDRPWSALDEALRLELTDVRREREQNDSPAQVETGLATAGQQRATSTPTIPDDEADRAAFSGGRDVQR